MLSLSNVASSSSAADSPKSFTLSLHAFPSFFFFSLHKSPSSPLRSRFLTKLSASSRLAESRRGDHSSENGESSSVAPGNYSAVKLQETVDIKAGKLRVDTWISSRINGVSRARMQSSIRSGLVAVNGRVVDKVSHSVRAGDRVDCTISELQPLSAEPEDIPVDIVHEDEHVLVVNKPVHMVVHPAPGNASGALVNAILHHCSLATVAFSDTQLLSEAEDVSDDESSSFSIYNVLAKGLNAPALAAPVRPGIVHRLDKGTSGLLVVAKIHAHAKYMGVPLVGDEVYGGTKNLILSLLQAKLPPIDRPSFRNWCHC